MATEIAPDKSYIIFGKRTTDQDLDIKLLAQRYSLNASSNFRKKFLGVFVHGTRGKTDVGGPHEFARARRNLINRVRDNRAVMFMSCYAGFSMARPLSYYIPCPIVAARAAVTIDANGKMEAVKMFGDKDNDFRLDWVVTKQGKLKVLSAGAVLTEEQALKAIKEI